MQSKQGEMSSTGLQSGQTSPGAVSQVTASSGTVSPVAVPTTSGQAAAAVEDMDPYSITPIEVMGDAQVFGAADDKFVESIVQKVLEHEALLSVEMRQSLSGICDSLLDADRVIR